MLIFGNESANDSDVPCLLWAICSALFWGWCVRVWPTHRDIVQQWRPACDFDGVLAGGEC